jgi:hypothetical protein
MQSTKMTFMPNGDKTWNLATLHAITMSLCLFILMGAIYTQMQPYKFTSSNMAFREALRMDTAEGINDLDDIWDWITDISKDIGGRTLGQVEANCAYNEPNTQFITVDGNTYEIHNPATQYQSCQNDAFVEAAEDTVYLTGDNELLLFGLFSKRSPEHFSMKKSVGGLKPHRVLDNAARPIDAGTDHKIVEACTAPWNEARKCIKDDGFLVSGYDSDSPGSALRWEGTYTDGKSVFDASTAHGTLHSAGETHYDLLPCYSYTASEELQWGDPSYTAEDVETYNLDNCKYTWITRGFDCRKLCLDYMNNQPTPHEAYVAKKYNFTDTIELIDFFNGCDNVLAASTDALEFVYTEALDAFRFHLRLDDSFGTFYNTTNQGTWIVDTTKVQSSLQFHHVLDANTRVFTLYVVTRNLGDDALFYSLLRVRFVQKTDGSVRVSLKPTFIPIIQV